MLSAWMRSIAMPNRTVKRGKDRDQLVRKQALIKSKLSFSLQTLAKPESERKLLELQGHQEKFVFSCITVEMQNVTGLFSFIIMPCSA